MILAQFRNYILKSEKMRKYADLSNENVFKKNLNRQTFNKQFATSRI